MHGSHAAAPAPEEEPGAHGEHIAAPAAAKVPAAHCEQPALLGAVTLPAKPAAHIEHELDADVLL